MVQRRAGPLVVPPPALPAPETSEAMNRSPLPLDGRGGRAMRAVHRGSLDLPKRDREPTRQRLSRQAALRSARTEYALAPVRDPVTLSRGHPTPVSIPNFIDRQIDLYHTSSFHVHRLSACCLC